MYLRIAILILATQFVAHAEVFDDWDKNKDQQLTVDELPKPLQKNFARVDGDNDGFISRDEHKQFQSRMSRGVPIPGYETKADIPYANTDNLRQQLDLFLPSKKSEEARPLLVFIHGGGWKGGSKRGGARSLTPYLDGNYVGASIGYRLSQESTWPAQIHDCKAAIRWLKGNADKYGIDPTRVVVFGTSAGGHLVAMLGTSADVKPLEGALGKYPSKSSRISGVIDFFGPSDLLSMGQSPAIDHDAADSPESKLVGGKLADHKDAARQASPTTFVSSDDATFLIVHGDKDRLVPFEQSKLLHQQLKAANVSSRFIRMQGGGHGFAHPELTKRVKQFLSNVFSDANTVISEQPIVVKGVEWEQVDRSR